VETAPLDRMDADLLQLDVPEGSLLAGVHIDELRLPVGAVVTLVLRDGTGFVPSPETVLESGDEVLAVLDPGLEEELKTYFGPDGTSPD